MSNVREFQRSVRDPELQEVLQYAKESKERNSEGIMGWLAAQHEDWLEQRPATATATATGKLGEGLMKSEWDGVFKIEDVGGEGEGKGDAGGAGKEGTVEEIVEGFRSRHPGVEVVVEGERENSMRVLLPPPARITFRIDATSAGGSGDKAMYSVSCGETGKPSTKPPKLFAGVVKALARRAKPGDLRHTLVSIPFLLHPLMSVR